jgi:serine-type D-Ala-D-Ala carboxypeptidase (penicillin-binding protein 5/6)
MYLSALSFVFIASWAFAATSMGDSEEKDPLTTKVSGYTNIKHPPLPVLTRDFTFPVLSAQSVYAVDIDSGVALYEKNPDLKLLPASTTKIITALVAIDHYNPKETLTAGYINVVGQKMNLYQGERITVENLLYGLLVSSANDAAEVLAQNYEGGREGFIVAMNMKAKALGLTNTNFENPSGLDGYTQLTTAKDLVLLSIYAMENELFAGIVATQNVNIKDENGKTTHRFSNINQLLGQVEGVAGIKTGWTENARENLVTYVERDGKRIIIALLASQDRFGETRELIEWLFNAYEWQDVKNQVDYDIFYKTSK